MDCGSVSVRAQDTRTLTTRSVGVGAMTTAIAALTLPDPQRATLPAIRARCREIYDRRDEVIGVVDLEAANAHRLGMNAIEKFVGNREGRDDVRRSARVLECAV